MNVRQIARALLILTLVAQCPNLVEGQTATPVDYAALAPGLITVDPAVTHQTMRGWEVVAQADQFRPDYQGYQDAALTKVIAAGFNRVRFEVRSGSENIVDSFGDWAAAGYPDEGYANTAWRAKRYETINDNTDPYVINPAGFHWSEIDSTVDLIINPLRQKISTKGESLYVNFNYVSFLGQVTSGAPYVHKDPAEYAEFMLAAFQHLQSKYGWTPDGIEVILEPDNTVPPWNGTLLGQVIVATAQRLAAAGFTPDFIGPATTCMSSAIGWFDQMIAVPGVRTHLKELSYHRYCSVDTGSLQTIASRVAANGLASSMLEWWDTGNSFHTLHEDLKVGRNSAWQQSVIVDHASANGLAVSYIDPAAPTAATLTNPTKFTRQYYQHVRRGAVRVDAASTSGALDPLAFRNPDGSYAVVVKAAAGETFAIAGLPAGKYGIYYTASSTAEASVADLVAQLPDQTIGTGQVLTTSIPAYGVITVYSKAQLTVPPAAPMNLRVTSVVGNNVTFRWTPPASGPVTGFLIEGGLAPAQTVGALPLGVVPSVTVTLPNGSYYLRVRTLDGAATSSASNEVLAHVNVPLPPSPPTNLLGLAVGDALNLTWTNSLAGGAPTTMILDVAGTLSGSLPLALTESFSFAGMPAGTYTFKIRAANAAGTSAASNPVTLTYPTACSGPPHPVANFEAYQLGGTLFLDWESGTGGPTPTSYVLNVTGSYVGSIPTPLRELSGVVPPGTYTLRVMAANPCGTSDESAPATVVVP